MHPTLSSKILTYFIALVWLINGLVCKVFNLVPRHQEIVGEILGRDFAPVLIKIIGVSEIFMAIWVFSRYKSRISAVLQIVIIATMNILEFALVPHLLLWGRLNLIFALLLIVLIYYNEFVLENKVVKA